MKQKVSMISTLPPAKGLSPYTLGLIKELSKDLEIDFYGFKKIYPEFLYPGGTTTKEKQPLIKNVRIINNFTWYNPFSWVKTGFQIDSEIVHAQWWSWILAPVFITTLSIGKLRGKKVILTVHNVKPHEKSFIKNFLNKSVLKLADEFIVHSEDNKELFLKEFKTKKKIHIIPHGIIEMKTSKLSVNNLRKKYGFDNMDKILFFFGNIRDYKGLDILLNSLNLLENEKIKLIIAGKPWGDFDSYQKQIETLSLSKQIKLFLEFNTEERLAELFKLSDLVIFPYKEFEASSGAGSVGLFYEKPLVITGVGGLPELVLDKKVIAKPNNSEDLKEKILYGLSNLTKLKKESKMRKKDFSWKEIAKRTEEVYG